MKRTPTLEVFCVAVLLACVLAPKALAQDPFGELLSPHLSSERFAQCLDELKLDDEAPRRTVMLLYGDLLVEHDVQAAETRRKLDEASAARRAYEKANDGRSAWLSEGKDFGNSRFQFEFRVWKRNRQLQFESDVAAILNDTQQTTWSVITTDLRRERVLPQLRFRRHLPDLADAMDDLELDAGTLEEVDAPHRAYIDELDPVLRQWEEVGLDLGHQMQSSGVSRSTPPEEAKRRRARHQQLWEQITQIRTAAWDVTETHIDEMLLALPEDRQRDFLDHTRAVIYPDIYQPSTADVLVERLRRATVDPERLAAIEAIYGEYLAARQANRDRFVEAIHRWEHPSDAELRRRIAEQQRLHDEGEDPWLIRRDNPARQPLHQRRDLARTTCLRIRALFADDEIADLPIGARMALQWAAETVPTRFSHRD